MSFLLFSHFSKTKIAYNCTYHAIFLSVSRSKYCTRVAKRRAFQDVARRSRLSISTPRAGGHNWQRRCRARTVRVDLIVPHVIKRRSCSRTRPLSSRHSV